MTVNRNLIRLQVLLCKYQSFISVDIQAAYSILIHISNAHCHKKMLLTSQEYDRCYPFV